MPDPVHLLAFWEATPGSEKALEELLLSLVAPSQAEEGCLRYEFYRAQDDPRKFTFVETWASQEALQAHAKSEHLRVVRERAEALGLGGGRVEICRKIDQENL